MKVQERREELNRYIHLLLALTIGLFVATYDHQLDSYNSSIMALNYSYGFISRGLLGTVYKGLDFLLPMDLMTYEAALYFTLLVTALFFAFLLWAIYKILYMVEREHLHSAEMIFMMLMIVIVPSFSAERNFGRVDLYMIICTTMGLVLLLNEWAEWLVIPLSAIGVMTHQAYVFMYFNVILVLLLYKIMTYQRKRKYYIFLFAMSFLLASVLFLWFNFFSHGSGETYVDEIIRNAAALSMNGEYHQSLIGHEVLGIDPSEDEWGYHLRNFVELPLLLLFFLPYIVWGLRLLRSTIREADDFLGKLKYLMVGIGSLTILPNLIIKCDYGRWMLSVVIYYLLISIAMLAMGDEIWTRHFHRIVDGVKERYKFYPLFFIYPILFLPFWDVNIDKITATLGNEINVLFLHWW